jgi:hypothetical protein
MLATFVLRSTQCSVYYSSPTELPATKKRSDVNSAWNFCLNGRTICDRLPNNLPVLWALTCTPNIAWQFSISFSFWLPMLVRIPEMPFTAVPIYSDISPRNWMPWSEHQCHTETENVCSSELVLTAKTIPAVDTWGYLHNHENGD